MRIASHGIEGLEPERPQGALVKEALLLRVHFLHGGAQEVRGLLSGVGALRERTDRHVGIVEPGAVHGRPVFPIDLRGRVELAGFLKLRFGHVHGNRQFERIEHVVHARFGFAELTRVVAVHRVDRGFHLLFRLVGVAGQAGFLDVVTRRRGPVVRVGRTVGLLHLGHVAGSAGGARLVVRRAEIGFDVGVLQLHELGAGERMHEVYEADLLIMRFDVVGVHPREVVRQTAFRHLDGLAVGGRPRIAGIFDVALRAHESAVGAVHRSDLAGEAANTGVLDRELHGIRRLIAVDARALFVAVHRVDQRVADDARLRRVRIMAEVAVERVVDGADHFDGVRTAVELGALDLVAHVGPVEHQVGRLAGPAHGVARGGDDSEKKSEMNSIFWLKDKYECIEQNTFWLSETPETESKYEGAGCNRICSYVMLRNKETGQVYLHMNTHLDNASDEARVFGAQVISDKIKEIKLTSSQSDFTIVLTGDFNDIESGNPCRTISEMLISCSAAAPENKKSTYTDWGDLENDGEPIDFIFTDGEPAGYLILDDTSNGYVSDHYGVYATIKL